MSKTDEARARLPRVWQAICDRFFEDFRVGRRPVPYAHAEADLLDWWAEAQLWNPTTGKRTTKFSVYQAYQAIFRHGSVTEKGGRRSSTFGGPPTANRSQGSRMPRPRKSNRKSPVPHKRLATIAQSERVRAFAQSRRKGNVITIKGISAPKFVTLMPAQMKKLSVDESYQRIRIKNEVNDLIHVLKNGGDIPDPITVARRADDSLWIVDGQQRWWAHSETNTPLKALIYDVDSLEAEKELYIVSNTRVKVGTNYMVKAHPGIGVEILNKLAEVPGSEVEGMVDFGTDKKRPLAAATAIRGMTVVATGALTSGQGNITNVLPRLDHELEHNMLARERCDAFLRLAIEVFGPKARIPTMPILALAGVCYRRWNGRPRPVPPVVLKRLQRIEWLHASGGSYAARFMPVIEGVITRIWKE